MGCAAWRWRRRRAAAGAAEEEAAEEVAAEEEALAFHAVVAAVQEEAQLLKVEEAAQQAAESARKVELERFGREREELEGKMKEATKAADAAQRALQAAAGPRASLERRVNDTEAELGAARAEAGEMARKLRDAPTQAEMERLLLDIEAPPPPCAQP